MIENLTKEQEKLLQVYANKWISRGLSTDQNVTEKDCERAVELVSKLVLEPGDPELKGYVLCDSPFEISKKVDSNAFLSESFYGNLEASWLSFFDYCKTVLGVKISEEFEYFKRSEEHTSELQSH